MWLDAYFIGYLQSTSAYATVSVTNAFLHWIMKAAEAFLVGTIILTGHLMVLAISMEQGGHLQVHFGFPVCWYGSGCYMLGLR